MSERYQGYLPIQKTKQPPTHIGSRDKPHLREHSEQSTILDFLPIGAENAISGPKLAELLGLTDRRELQRLIANERRHGAIVCANSQG